MTAQHTLEGKAAEPRNVLVTGVTGQQGGATARLLLERGHKVRGLTRKPEGPAANALRQLGAEIVEADLARPDRLTAVFSGVDAAFVVATPFEAGPEAETSQAVNAMDAAQAAGVRHVVYSSVSDANQRTGIPHFESKARAEEHLGGLAVDHTIVAPVFFMDNLASPWMAAGLAKGVLAMGLPADRRLQGVAVRDIARFTTLVLERPKEFNRQRINIAGDELPPAAMAELIGTAAGRTITFQQVPLDQVRRQSEDSARMFEWFDRVGYSADVASLKKRYPQVAWLGFRDWVAAQPWERILSAPPPAWG